MIGWALFITTLVVIGFMLIAGFRPYGQWSVNDFVGTHSYFLKATFIVWNPAHWKNKTDDLFQDSFDGTPLSVSFGVFDAVVNCLGWLQEHVLLDIALLLSFSFSQTIARLLRHIQDEDASLDAKWGEYEEIKKASNNINRTFQYFLALAHVNNLFVLSYFLLRLYDGKTRFVNILLQGVKVAKIVLTYYFTSAAAHKVREQSQALR